MRQLINANAIRAVGDQAVMIRQQDGIALLQELEQGLTVEMSFSTVQVGRGIGGSILLPRLLRAC